MIETTIRIERPEGTAVATGIPAQYDVNNLDIRNDEGHDRDFTLLDLYLAWVPASGLYLRDVVFDERNTDPATGALLKMRVAGVETFGTDHVEARCQQVIGD